MQISLCSKPLRAVAVIAIAWHISMGASARAAAPSDEELLNQFASGQLANAELLVSDALKTAPADDNLRLRLGCVQFVRAVEKLTQDIYSFGMRDPDDFGQGLFGMVPYARLPLPKNPSPKKVAYEDARQILETFNRQLSHVAGTLSTIQDDTIGFKFPIGMVRMDIDANGTASEQESLWQMYLVLNRGVSVTREDAKGFVLGLDIGDARWLEAYCHFLMAMNELALAHDLQDMFNRCGHMIFARPETPYAFLADRSGANEQWSEDIVDLIALIHSVNFPVKEPARMQASLEHFEAMFRLSTESWTFILAEKDNDLEWIPNPAQKSVISNVRVTSEMANTWLAFLKEAQALFAGEKLIPFWRSGETRGVNLRKVFTEPRDFDLVLWVQGTPAVPYLEEGQMTDQRVWGQLQQVFQGDLLGFALWFN